MEENEKDVEKSNAKPKVTKGYVCKGVLYHSSTRKSNSKNPFCLGFTHTFPRQVLGEKEDSEAASEKDPFNRSIPSFKYGCIGYSGHLDKDDPLLKRMNEPAICHGFELIVRNWSDRASAHVHSKQEVQSSHSQSDEPSTSVEPSITPSYEFQKRLARNALVVASGVGSSAIRMGNRIKNRLIDAIYPFRKRDD